MKNEEKRGKKGVSYFKKIQYIAGEIWTMSQTYIFKAN